MLYNIAEEARHILILSAKYHSEESGHFIFNVFPIFWFIFEFLLTMSPKPVLNIKSVNVRIYCALMCVGSRVNVAVCYFLQVHL